MDPAEQAITDMIETSLSRVGGKATEAHIRQVRSLTLLDADARLWRMSRLSRNEGCQTVYSSFQGVRVVVRIASPCPGMVTFISDLAEDTPVSIDYDLGWGPNGLLLDDREQLDLLRVVYARVAEDLRSSHARLEFLAELQEGVGPRPLPTVWHLLPAIPDALAIERACRESQGLWG